MPSGNGDSVIKSYRNQEQQWRSAEENPTWLHLIVSIHAVSALSLCVFTVLGYVASTIPMTLVVLFIFQMFAAILGLKAIERSQREYRSLYKTVNAVTAASATIWSIFLFINVEQHSVYVPVVLLILALFSLIATVLLIFCADKKIPGCLKKVICLDIIGAFPLSKLFPGIDKTNAQNLQSKSTRIKCAVHI